MKIKPISFHSLLLIGILALAAGFRCYHYFQIPYTNDELSALYRLQYDSISELITHGISVDGHPALVQLFLYYYCKLLGYQEWLVKLPFIFAGLLSIWLAYKIAAIACNRNLGLLIAAFMASTQYYVMYSQLARPYSPGLLFTMLFLYLGLFIIHGHNRKPINYIAFALAMMLCAITHYFSFLAALLLLGCFLVAEKKEGRTKMLLASILALLFTLPHFPIFLQQLQTGGIGGATGWLSKPTLSFVPNYFAYIFQYQLIAFLFYSACSVISVFYLFRSPARDFKLLAMCLFVFIASFFIGYIYSVLRNPVMQYSVLLFASPLLFLFVFYGISKMRLRFVYGMIVLIISFNAYGMIVKRQHYNLFYHQGYQAAAQSLIKFPNIHLYANGNSEFYFQYYFNKFNITPTIQTTRFDSLTYGELSELLTNSNADTVALICGMPTDPEYFILAQNFLPNVVKEEYGASFHSLILSRSVGLKTPSINQIETKEVESQMEFNEETTLSISKINHGDLLRASAFIDFHKDCTANPLLVVVAEDESHKQLFWKAVSTNEFKIKGQKSTKISITLRIEDVVNIPHPIFKAFIWNKDKQKFNTSIPHLQVNKGNPILYGIIADF